MKIAVKKTYFEKNNEVSIKITYENKKKENEDDDE